MVKNLFEDPSPSHGRKGVSKVLCWVVSKPRTRRKRDPFEEQSPKLFNFVEVGFFQTFLSCLFRENIVTT